MQYKKPAWAMTRGELYICCDQFNFDWTIWAVSRFDRLWSDGKDLGQIAAIMDREEIEIFFLYIDRVYSQKIKPDTKRIFYQ